MRQASYGLQRRNTQLAMSSNEERRHCSSPVDCAEAEQVAKSMEKVVGALPKIARSFFGCESRENGVSSQKRSFSRYFQENLVGIPV